MLKFQYLVISSSHAGFLEEDRGHPAQVYPTQSPEK